ncbi:hypothetical protein KAFR_0I02310 [Kazachstania africana CBS 2517]|uniref:Uncharacterized protein n=1 Tax=Kazachstania africana (strain ATCC 22294 / BCRC 22015 / CBS 2517 / CECT 1963 / NBRC 1671 / NRRL Y-8276) TaxID=1071382 RepID=H2B060_KAZAF|nr:hypothetical protein KAFR_0I02310 [Kazachstania africana CBS 2517]CCF60010.1 hypothetical protein KAFR_0I02310 [Kazachstania africana CBS 2517]
MILRLTQFISQLLNVFALQSQIRFNRLHKSIYGISYDYYILETLICIASIYYSTNYQFNTTARSQLMLRYPVWFETESLSSVISNVLIILEVSRLVGLFLVDRQLRLYYRTKHEFQGYSTICRIVIGTFWLLFVVSIIIIFKIKSGKLFVLDHFDITWTLTQLLKIGSLWPQICINWMTRSCKGMSINFIKFSIISNIIIVLGILVENKNNFQFQLPFNSEVLFVTLIRLINMLIVLYQQQFLYNNKTIVIY